MAFIQIYVMLITKLPQQPVCHEFIKIIPAEVIISMACEHLCDLFFHSHYGYVKCASAKIVYHDCASFVRTIAVSKARRSRFIEYADYIKTCKLSGFTRGIALGIRKIGRDCNHGLFYGHAESPVCPFSQFAKDQGGYLLWSESLVVDSHDFVAAHLPFYAPHGTFGI